MSDNTSDIVDRLRAQPSRDGFSAPDTNALLEEAADEIERLQSSMEAQIREVQFRFVRQFDKLKEESVRLQDENERMRKALAWAYDRLEEGDMTAKEQRTTARELGNVLKGKPSQVDTFEPNEWDASYDLLNAREKA